MFQATQCVVICDSGRRKLREEETSPKDADQSVKDNTQSFELPT